VVGSVAAAAGGLVAAGLLGNSAWALLAISVGAIGFFAMPACFWPLPPMFLSGTAAAGGIAIINAIGNLGGFIGPYGVGWIAATTGNFTDGLYFLAGCAALSGVIVLAMGRPRVPAAEAMADHAG
jgi:MFS transporter, ACS family, tartrate transporter